MKLAIGCDDSGYELKEILRSFLAEQKEIEVEVVDLGIHSPDPVDYPDIALKLAESIASGENERGILICGTGIGMAIAANKVPGVRAAQVTDPYGAERARKSNNAQIMTLGALTTGKEVAKSLVMIWLHSEFQGGRSARKVAKIDEIDAHYHSDRADDQVPSCTC